MNVLDFAKAKVEKRKLTMVTCYDAWSARIIEASPIDIVLVGDSAAMVMHGFPSTVHATVEMMAMHTAAVARGLKTKFLVGDLPFLSFRRGPEAALAAVDALMKAGAHCVKLEGVWGHEETIDRIVRSGVPVMGHIGLTPQSVHGFGGFKVQGREEESARDLLKQAKRLEELGCCSIVLECVPSALGTEITRSVGVPTIGIGAGPDCDGQVLVLHDLLGADTSFKKPKFVRRFTDLERQVAGALRAYTNGVVEGTYPAREESYE